MPHPRVTCIVCGGQFMPRNDGLPRGHGGAPGSYCRSPYPQYVPPKPEGPTHTTSRPGTSATPAPKDDQLDRIEQKLDNLIREVGQLNAKISILIRKS